MASVQCIPERYVRRIEFEELIYDDCIKNVWWKFDLCLGLIIVVPVLLVVRIWENVSESGSLEVKCGNCV